LIVIGIDAHKDTHTAAALDATTARPVEDKTVQARQHGHFELLRWARRLDDQRVWAIEDCRNYSGTLEQLLIAHGERVLRVPPKLSSSQRKTMRSFGKSDTIDATAAALAAIRVPDLPEAKPHGQTRELRLLADHRDDLVQENTRYQRRLRQHVHEIDPDLAPALRGLNNATNLDRLARQLAKRQQTAQVAIARELVRRIRELAKRTRQLHTEITRLVRARCPQLLEIEGCGPITAARIYAEVDGIDRFKNERHLASYAGIAPLDASSGRQQRHRLNRTGNRRLNRALHTIAVTQLRIHPPARAYIARRLTDGKTNREALRALKRHLIRRLYNQLRTESTSLTT
jgi:transposase